ncbi:MAG TPA: TraB/GumN family protein [Steroidobacteraceae bacterium]|nr:TraB/GumN family protein [Steroidobacteraceae bacterium]
MAGSACRWLLALGLLGCLSAEAAAPVWAIRGAHNTVYLAGSIHLLPEADAALPPAFARAYADSACLVMEIDLGKLDPAGALDTLMQHGGLPEATSLREIAGAPRYARASTAAAALGLPAVSLDHEAPWMVALQLTELEYARLGFDPEQGVEQQLLRRALADHKTTDGLESLADEMGVFEALTPAAQLRFLDMVLDDLDDTGEETRAVLGAWRRGDAARLATLLAAEYRSFPALYDALVMDRNRHWLPHIEQLLKGDENCLVVVGALHLVGEGGLLELLRRDGIVGQQLD